MPRRASRALGRSASAGAALLLLLALLFPTAGSATPPLPIEKGGELLSTLSLPSAAPGASSTLGFVVSDPFFANLYNLSLTFELYSFNPAPGTGPTGLPTSSPSFAGGSAGGLSRLLTYPELVPAEPWTAPVTLSIPGGAPLGAYAVRDSLTFTMNGTAYLLDSRGYFTESQWTSATVLPNGSPTLNLSRLGVSGVLPETALLVDNPAPVAYALYALLGAAILLAGAGAYLAARRPRRSSSGAVGPPREKAAPTAFGNSRRSDGD
jgi:hypothetical protein